MRNICTAEALKRFDAMRASAAYAAARAIPRDEDHRIERRTAFQAARTAFGFGKFAMQPFARQARDAFWIKDHIGGHDCETISNDAFRAAERHAFGRGGRPQFKRIAEMRSISSKDNRNFMRLKGDLEDGPSGYVFEYRGLRLRLRRRQFSESESRSLAMPHLLYRVVRHRDTARERYALQIVVDGPARIHRPRNAGDVGIDVGPSTIAAVSRDDAIVETFCPDVVQPWAEMRRLQRRIDRSMRAANPDCFREDGTFIKGKRARKRSKTLIRLRSQLRRREAKLAQRRRNAHGRMSNRILGQGTRVRAEKLSHVALQKSFGRSAKVRASGAFFSELKRKAEAVGGRIVPIPAWKAKLSQLDHAAGDYIAKPLSLRRHAMRDGSGIVVDRDVYSAFLALHCDADGVVDRSNAAGFVVVPTDVWHAVKARPGWTRAGLRRHPQG